MAHKVNLPRQKKNRTALANDLKKYKMEIGNARQALLQAAVIAEKMSEAGFKLIRHVYKLQDGNDVNNFNRAPILVEYFGKAEKKGDVKDVYNRMRSAHNRITKGLTIKLHPQDDRTGNAKNMGTFFDRKTFRVFPKLFDGFTDRSNDVDTKFLAQVFIHEMLHEWFDDQTIKGKKVYGKDMALELATLNSKKARRSAENYEHFCRTLYPG